MMLRALQNCLLIERDIEKHDFLVLPAEKLGTGMVISAGPDCIELKVGDHVYFDVGQEFTYDRKDYVVMREPHVLGVLNG
jgi:co-chaperonin GroES (HSP10)